MSLSKVLSSIDSETKSKGRRRGIQPSFKALVDTYLEHRKKFNDYRGRIERNDVVGFHPSGLLNSCPRKIAFQFVYEKNNFKKNIIEEDLHELKTATNGSRLEFIFDVGHAVHFLIQYGYLPDMEKIYGIKYKVEIPSLKSFAKYLIAGTGDIEIVLQDNIWWVVDIKTMGMKSFYSLKTKQDFIDKYPGYVVQLMLYIKGLGRKKGLIYIVCKDNSDTKEFYFDYDERLIKKELQSSLKAKGLLLGKSYSSILPECKRREGRYKKCAFSSVCFQIKNKQALLKLTTKKKNSELIK